MPTHTAGIFLHKIQSLTTAPASSYPRASRERADGCEVSRSDSDRQSYRPSDPITIRGGYSTMSI